MADTITIYRRTSSDTVHFGLSPSYHLDKPEHSDTKMIWVDPVDITLPDGYHIAEANDGCKYLYDSTGNHEPIVDDNGHPAIILGVGLAKDGRPYTRFRRLDD